MIRKKEKEIERMEKKLKDYISKKD